MLVVFLFVFNYLVEFFDWTLSAYKAVITVRIETLVKIVSSG